jgi:hypothetical protein
MIGTEVHEIKSSMGGVARVYVLEKWNTESGYELGVHRSSQGVIILPHNQDDRSELLTTYIGPALDELLTQARLDLDSEVIR